MTSPLAKQLGPSGNNGPLAYPAASGGVGSSALILDRDFEGNVPSGITEFTTQSAFLELLLNSEGSAESLLLREHLATARRQNKCILRQIVRMGALLLLSLSGLGYFSFVQSEFFSVRAQALIQNGLIFLCLVSLISGAQFIGYLIWHWVLIQRMHRQCRRLVLTLIGQRLADSRQAPCPSTWAAASPTGLATQPVAVPVPGQPEST